MTNNTLKRDEVRETAWEQYEILRKTVKAQTGVFLVLGETLKKIRDDKLYLYLGMGGFDTFKDFLNNPEISIRPSTAMSYIAVYEVYVDRMRLTTDEVMQVSYNRLRQMLPVTRNLLEEDPDKAREFVQDSKDLTNVDFDKNMVDKGFTIERPEVWADKETGLWLIRFNPETTKKVINSKTNDTIYETEVLQP